MLDERQKRLDLRIVATWMNTPAPDILDEIGIVPDERAIEELGLFIQTIVSKVPGESSPFLPAAVRNRLGNSVQPPLTRTPNFNRMDY